MTVLICEM